MVFKKTSGQQTSVTPTGMPDFSGFNQANKQFMALSEAAFSIGTGIRKKEYNDAILQAEIDGKTAGARYETDPETGEQKLVPLTTLDYAKASSMYSKDEQDAVLNAYKKAAISTYALSAGNDAIGMANQAHAMHPNDPDAVRGVAAGYFESLKKLPPEIFAAVAPKATYAFTSAENQSLAQQQKESRADSIKTLTTAFSENTRRLSNLAAKGGSGTAEENAGMNQMILEISEEQESIIESLETFGYGESEINDMLNLQETVITSRVGQATVERAFQAGGLPAAMTHAMQIVEENFDNPEVDVEALSGVLFQSANRLESLRSAQVSMDNRIKDDIYHQIIMQSVVYGADVTAMIGDPTHPIHMLQGSRVASLYQQGKAATDKAISDEYNNNIGYLTNWKVYNTVEDRRLITDGYVNIRRQWLKGELTPTEWANAKKSFNEYTDHVLNSGERRDIGMAMAMALGPNSTYEKVPQVYAKLMPDLIAKGVIGPNGIYKTESQFLNALDDYSTRWKKHDEEERAAQRGFRQLRLGLPLGDAEQKAVDNIYGTSKAIVGDQVVEMDFFSEDGEVFQASVDTADAYSHRFNGLLHPNARILFKNYMNNPAAANIAAKVLSQMATGLVKSDEYTFTNEGQALDHIWRINDFTPEARKFFQIASISSVELAMEATQWKQRSESERNLTDIVMPGISDELNKAERADAFFDKAVSDALGAFDFYNFVDFDQQGPVVQQMLEGMAAGTGINVDDLADVVIRDPVLRQQMKDLFFERYIYEHKLNLPAKDTMRSVFASFGTRYGFEKDPETGEVNYVRNPILRNAQATVPPIEKGKHRGRPIFEVNMSMIEQDFAYRMNGVGESVPGLLPGEYQRDMRDLMLPEDNIYKARVRFVANEVAAEGNIPTYSVYLTDRYGVTKLYSPSYSFQYATSHMSQDYEKAVSHIKSNTVKNIMRIGNAFDPLLIQAQVNKYAASRNLNDLYPIIDFVNKITSATAGTGFDLSGYRLTDQDGDDFITMRELFYSLGTY